MYPSRDIIRYFGAGQNGPSLINHYSGFSVFFHINISSIVFFFRETTFQAKII